MIKHIFVKSALQNNEVEARFLDDKEWKIVLKCADFGESRGESRESNVDLGDSRGESSGDFGDSGADLGESSADSNDLGESSADSQITITFFALENDIDCLVRGYLQTFLGFDFANFKRENNRIFVDSPLRKDEIFSRLSQKDIIQSCEQISLNDKKIMRDSVIMPFNGSRTTIKCDILEANREFFQNGESSNFSAPTCHSEGAKRPKNPQTKSEFLDSSLHTSCYAQNDECKVNLGESSDFPYKARIILNLESLEFNAESFDTNPKNAIYKAIGKAFYCATKSEQIATKSSLLKSEQIVTHTRHSEGFSPKNPNLLDCVIFLNFRPDLESLKILLLQKCTFIVCEGIPSFSVVRFAQKFGITLIAFANNDFLILTHALRFKS